MKSEKVREIKRALELGAEIGMSTQSETFIIDVKVSDILTLINELESENERLNKSEIGELIKENEELAKQCVEWSELDFKKRNKITELEDRIAELEKGKEQTMKMWLEDRKGMFWDGVEEGELKGYKQLKQFAERLKEMAYKSTDWSHGEHPLVVEVDYIDEVLEEFTDDR